MSPNATDRSGRWAVAATAVAVAPVVVAGVRAAAGGWVPVGDQAYFTVRSRDVLTGHHPWVGAFSSASVDRSRPFNNLGPLQFDLLAPFTKVAPWGGTALGTVFVHVAAIITTAWLVARIGGRRAVPPALAAITLLTWTMGSERLISPVQHPYLVLPFVAFLTAAWATALGDRWAPVALVAAGSLCLQTHLSYPILLLVVGAVAGAGWLRTADPDRRLPLGVVAAVTVAVWFQPLVDQVSGTGNLGDVLRGSFGGSAGDTGHPGPGTALRIVAGTLGDPARLVRGGFPAQEEAVPRGGVVAVLALVALWGAAVAVASGVRLPRIGRCGPAARAGATVWAAAVAAGVLTAWRLPETVFHFPVTNYRWLWALAAFGLLGALTAVARRSPPAAWLAPVVVLAVVNLPTGPHDAATDPAAVRVVAALVAELEHGGLLDGVDGPLRFDDSHLYFGHPYNYPVMAVLQTRGIDLHFVEEYHVRRFGAGRRADGREPATIVLYHGDEARRLAGQPAAVVIDRDGRAVAATLERP